MVWIEHWSIGVGEDWAKERQGLRELLVEKRALEEQDKWIGECRHGKVWYQGRLQG
jgi:hypothetical protein